MGIDNNNLYGQYKDLDTEPIEQEEIISEFEETTQEKDLTEKEEVPYSIEFDNSDLINENSIEKAKIVDEEESLGIDLDDFDLRKAVIYSEIINRKQY